MISSFGSVTFAVFFLAVRAMKKVTLPTLPRNIHRMTTHREISERERVMPVVMPTVLQALATSNTTSLSGRNASAMPITITAQINRRA